MTDWGAIEQQAQQQDGATPVGSGSPWDAIEGEIQQARRSQAAAVNVVAQMGDADKAARAARRGLARHQQPVEAGARCRRANPRCRGPTTQSGGSGRLGRGQHGDRGDDDRAGRWGGGAVAREAGDASQIKDLLRATIVAPDLARAREILAAIDQRFQVLAKGRRNLLDPAIEPRDGYRDAKVNVDLDGHTAEIQVSIPGQDEC